MCISGSIRGPSMCRVLSSPVGPVLEIILASRFPLHVLPPWRSVGPAAGARRGPHSSSEPSAARRTMVRLFCSRSGSLCPLAASLRVLDLWPEPPSIRVGTDRPKHLILRTLEGVGSRDSNLTGGSYSRRPGQVAGEATAEAIQMSGALAMFRSFHMRSRIPARHAVTQLVLIGRSASDASPPPPDRPNDRPSHQQACSCYLIHNQ